MSAPTAWASAHQHWCAARQQQLASPDSFLGWQGLVWLEEGETAIGSDPACPVCVPSAPLHWGRLLVAGERVSWQADGLAALPLQTDQYGAPDEVACGDWVWQVIVREGRLAVRLRDRAWQARQPYPQLAHAAYDPVYRLLAIWAPLPEPRLLEMLDASGAVQVRQVTHAATFTLHGQTHRLLPHRVTAEQVMFVLRDQGSGRISYGGGRFLDCPAPQDGQLLLDFNYAANPPCAFTAFATCPLPPPENWLPLILPVGELRWLGAH